MPAAAALICSCETRTEGYTRRLASTACRSVITVAAAACWAGSPAAVNRTENHVSVPIRVILDFIGNVLFPFNKFTKELAHLASRRQQRFPAQRGRPVDSPERAPVSLLHRPQIAFTLEALQQRIEAPRTDPITMACQLFDHSQAEDRTLDGMMEH